jgi:catechol 2,3-dioxygenase-like lactoylglutathione lyase family enzyme
MASSSSLGVRGWREALVIVRDPAPWIETLTVVGGWEVAHHGAPDTALNALWSLPSGSTTEQVLMRNIGTQKGFMRLVRVTGAPQRPIRPDDQAWETGGIQALDVRVVDMEKTREALHLRGWRSPSEPVRYTTYGVEVIQWAPSSPDGVRLSFIQRLNPPLQGWTELKRWSRIANAAISTKDMAAAKAFMGQTLGMAQISHSDTVGGDGPNVMGLPWNYARRLAIDIAGFASATDPDGAIELISMPDAQGRDYAAWSHPPNLGIAGLRIHLSDIDAFAARLRDRGTQLTPTMDMEIAPYGPCRVFAATGADGVWFEFIEPKTRA